VTIRARHKSPGGDIWERMVGEYNARGGPIQIQFERAAGTEEHHDKIAIEMAGGVAPDVFEMESKRMPSFVNGRLLDLTRRFAASKQLPRTAFFPGDWDRAFWLGKQYLLPQFDNPAALYYHPGLFQRRGVPLPPEQAGDTWTWARFLETAQRLTNPGEGTFGYNQSEWWVYLEPWVWSNGGDFLSKDRRRLLLDEPAAQQAITYAVDLRLKHRVMPDAGELQAAGNLPAVFFAGQLGMQLNISNWCETVRPRADVPWNIAPVPRGPAGFTPRSPATMWAMGAETRQPDRAFEVFEHFGSPEVHRQIPMLPSRRDVTEAGQFLYAQSIPGLKWQVFVDAKRAARDDPPTAAFQDLDRLLRAEEVKLWRGQLTPRDYAATVKPGVEQVLAEAERSGR
jgi:multiple sugar transport system substrate-binding protein